MSARWLSTLLILVGTATAQDEIVFTPYDANAPDATVGGSIRGAEGNLSVAVLAPGQLAVTAQAKPELYWFASSPVEDPVELVLIEEGGEEPVVEVTLNPPMQAGIHAFQIDQEALQVGTSYQWSVAVVTDPDARSNDVFASALMTRIEAPANAPEFSDDLARARWLAGQGIWYDAMAALSQAARSGSDQARATRAALLGQVGLDEIARFEEQEIAR